ncbi:MAG TPA: LLM class F420-dependent oxidoreductase [Acidimicrobiales bacterium]
MDVRIFTEPQQGATYDDLLAVARLTEELGFDAFFRSDHYQAFSGDGRPGPTDAWTTLAGLARETSRIRLGTLVSPVTFRPPGPLAVIVAQVDAMSGGRIELGMGTGWHDGEHTAMGIPVPPIGERFAMLEEQLEVVTGLWQATGPFTYRGSHYQLVDNPALPKPAQRPHPPLILGGAGARRTPRLAARFADELNVPFHRLEDTSRQYDRVREACADAGRDPETLTLSVAITVCCGSTEDELARRAGAIGRTVEAVRQWDAGGLPGEVVERLRGYAEVGARRVYLQVLDLHDLDHLRLIAAEVLPHL